MKCPNCEKEISPEFNICPWCGYKPKKCKNPEHQDLWLPDIAHYCPRCGEPLSSENSNGESPRRKNETNKDLEFDVDGIGFTMVYVEGGTFMMGAQSDDADADNYDPDAHPYESPVHKVTLCDYHIGETPVTQELWEAVMDGNPSCFDGSDNPVDSVSWDDCREFIRKLNSKLRDQLPHGYKFQLPTEAQWEFAARGGNDSLDYTYSGGDDIDDVGWYDDNSNDETHPVMEKEANELGLYDMSGNVLEWCQDWFNGEYENENQYDPKGPSSGSYRVLRGGTYYDFAGACRVSYRSNGRPGHHDSDVGFRLALVQQ